MGGERIPVILRGADLVDRVYKAEIPALRAALEKLRKEFSGLGPKTDWTELRIDPVLAHARSLERLLNAREHAREVARLRRSVVLFHADLVYLRENVRGPKRILELERNASSRRERKRPD
ncbi:MAG: hypothetical protein L3K19_03020 [Thermoplasmata archaeon]|nr:hypothetical protein [Thermoplasmata archaeon]